MINKLVEKIVKQGAPVVVGLDPMMKFVPKHLKEAAFEQYRGVVFVVFIRVMLGVHGLEPWTQ